MYTFGQLKTDVRQRVFPGGEASSLVAAHNKAFVDALIDLQTWVDCLQQDNTDVIPHCATFYNCGLTVLDAPRGNIQSVSVIDKIDPETGLEDADAEDDWCSEIVYTPVDFCSVKRFLYQSSAAGCCLSIPAYFALSGDACTKACYPVPTDEGVPAGLPLLPLGYHYPQTSTDSTISRALAGRWAIERGKLYIAPWIQSTESVVIKWDGIKRIWTDADLVDEDPLLTRAVEAWVRWDHQDKYGHDADEAARALAGYNEARAMLMHQCTEENRLRECEPSRARGSPQSLVTLYHNSAQTATAHCPDGYTGNPVTVTIPAGTVGSSISVADANQKAQDEAERQAQAQLVCTVEAVTYFNDAQTATAACEHSAGAPVPEGDPVTVTIPAGTVTSTISKADANEQAMALALQQAGAQLTCVYWNRTVSRSAVCATDPGISEEATVAEHEYSSTHSQAEADAEAATQAQNLANQALIDAGTCPDVQVYWNEARTITRQSIVPLTVWPFSCQCIVNVTVEAHEVSATSQSLANQMADSMGYQLATMRLEVLVAERQCGIFSYVWGQP